MISDQDVMLIQSIQEKYIQANKPDMLNGNNMLVRLDLLNAGRYDLEKIYAQHTACGMKRFQDHPQIVANIEKLKEIDSKVNMPEWGYNGT